MKKIIATITFIIVIVIVIFFIVVNSKEFNLTEHSDLKNYFNDLDNSHIYIYDLALDKKILINDNDDKYQVVNLLKK